MSDWRIQWVISRHCLRRWRCSFRWRGNLSLAVLHRPTSSIFELLQRVGNIPFITASRCLNRRVLSSEIYLGASQFFVLFPANSLAAIDKKWDTTRFDISWHQAFNEACPFLQLLDGIRRVNITTLQFHWNGDEVPLVCVNVEENQITLRFHCAVGWERTIDI